ncbi:flagellar biosynthesis anti-sigma factor FlgM [Alkalicoccus luteus]|nr:flagellar biosynthesis anti-sigma factor FlgM [Alkalicoccus luteus]
MEEMTLLRAEGGGARMKINPMHSVQAYKSQQNVQRQQQEIVKKADQLEISAQAKELAKAREFTEAREQKVQELKAQVQNGTYKPDLNETARKMYDYWNK